jgi:membrane protease YdiL (CAAX protease family)
MSGLVQLSLFLFLLLAAWDLRSSAWEGARVWRRPLQAGAALACLILLGCAAIFLTAAHSTPSELAGRLLLWGLLFEIPLVLFLAAILRNARGGRPRLLNRPFPLLSFLGLRHTARGRHLLRFRRVALAETAAWLAAILAFVAVWIRMAARFFGARPHDRIREVFPGSWEEVDLALVISLYLPILLAPFIEEIIFRGYIQEKITRLFRAAARGHRVGLGYRAVLRYLTGPLGGEPGPAQGTVPGAAPGAVSRCSAQGAVPWPSAAAICVTSALWALQHEGMISPEWVKWVQIFGVGIVLGVARLRLGLEACMALHFLHNILAGWCVPAMTDGG